jgi:DNA-binding SARP family transcriptional activator
MIEFQTLGSVELRGPTGDPLHSIAAQPKRLALLAYLCLAAPRGFHRRDTLLALFWPESDQGHARTSLRNAIHVLRGALGADAVISRGDEQVSINFQRIRCDAVAFDEAVTEGREQDAVSVYRGDFLPGFFIRDVPDWERWLEGERSRLRSLAAETASTMAQRAEGDGNVSAALRWATRAVELTGDDERAVRRLLELFDRADDKAGALGAYDAFARRLAADYNTEPAAETRALAEHIRTRATYGHGVAAHSAPVQSPSSLGSPPTDVSATDVRSESTRKQRLLRLARTYRAAGITAAVGVGMAVFLASTRNGHTADTGSPYRIAVFPFRVLGDTSWTYMREAAMDLVSGDIDGVGDVRRVDPAMLTSRLRREGATDVDQGLARRISTELGAGRYVLGTVVGEADHANISASLYSASRDGGPIAEARTDTKRDSMSRRVMGLALDLLKNQRVGQGGRLSQVGSIHARTYAAERAYFRGETMLRRGMYDSAGFAYEEAVREDSTFALAWFRLADAQSMGARGSLIESIDASMRFRDRLGGRDRLVVEANHAALHGDGKRAEERALAAVTAYPDEMEAWLAVGTTRWWYAWQLGRSPALARPAVERALALDPDYRETLHMMHILALLERRYADVMPSAERAYAPKSPVAFNLTSARAVSAFAGTDTAAQHAVLTELSRVAEFSLFQSAAFVASYTDNLGGARRITELMTESASRSPTAQGRGHVMLALLALAGGARHTALKEFGLAAALDSTVAFLYEGVLTAVPEFGFDDTDLRALRGKLLHWRATTHEDDMQIPWLVIPGELAPPLRVYALGLLSARLGDDALALSYADALRGASEPSDSAGLLPDLALEIRALVAARKGDSSSALADLEGARLRVLWDDQVVSPLHERPVGRFLRARFLHARGRETEALGWYSSLSSLSMIEFVFLAPTYLHEGEIYERAQQPAQAVEYYSRFVERWKECDGELRPLVDDARQRIVRLTAEMKR